MKTMREEIQMDDGKCADLGALALMRRRVWLIIHLTLEPPTADAL